MTCTRLAALTVALIFAVGTAYAQRRTETNSNLWVSYLGDYRLSEHWSIHNEAHWRRANLGEHWQQLLIRPAVNFHLNPNVMFTVGYSYYENFGYGDNPIRFRNWEHHAFEQVQFSHTLGRLKLTHRYRFEQRYIASLRPTPNDPQNPAFDHFNYLNRFRYRLLLTLPLNHPTLVAKTWFVSAYDEAFLTFGDPSHGDFVQQNRASVLLGYQWNALGSVQVGYMLQSLNRPGFVSGADLMEMNNTLHLIITYNLDFRKPKS